VFGRIVWKMLRGGKGRIFVALLAVTSGAAVISALLNVQFDMQRKLSEEFRTLGANLVITARGVSQPVTNATEPVLMDQAAVKSAIDETGVKWVGMHRTRPFPYASVPYLYIVARVADTPVVIAGTDLNLASNVNPTWKFVKSVRRSFPVGDWAWTSGYCIVGQDVARQLRLDVRDHVEIHYLGRSVALNVGAIIDTGAAEDDQILADLATVQNLAGMKGRIELELIRVDGPAANVRAHVAALAAALPDYDVRPIGAVTEAEGNLLHRTRLLIASMVALILVLTALCVLATMAALAMERREDVGLMKALGGSIARIVSLFLAEVSVLGATGGLIGCVIGIVLAQWMGRRVFETSIAPRWEIFPLTIAMMVVVALAGALPLRLLGKVKPAVILRGE
jgi:putative ABC transport system permease protein